MNSNTLRSSLPVAALFVVACASPSGAFEVGRPRPFRTSPALQVGPDSPAALDSPGSRMSSGVVQLDADAALEARTELDAFVAVALRESPRVAAAHERWMAARQRIPQAVAWPDPVLRARYFAQEVQTRVGPQKFSLGLSQTIPRSSKNEATGNLATMRAATEHARVTQIAADVIVAVKLTWYELYYLERAIEIVQDNHDLLERLDEVVRIRYASGVATHADFIRSQVELERSADQLRGLEDRRRPLASRWHAALHTENVAPAPQPTSIEADSSVTPPLVLSGKLRAFARAENPELGVLRLALAAAEGEIDFARVAQRPDFTLGLEYISTDSGGVPGGGEDPIILSLAFPLPLRTQRERAMKRESLSMYRAALEDIEAEEDRLEQKLAEELYRIRDAERRIDLYTGGLLPKAAQTLESTETAFRAGSADFLDLVDAERTQLDFKLTLARALTDRAIAIAKLERLVGGPVTNVTTLAPGAPGEGDSQ